jgi:hypothetical protein
VAQNPADLRRPIELKEDERANPLAMVDRGLAWRIGAGHTNTEADRDRSRLRGGGAMNATIVDIVG